MQALPFRAVAALPKLLLLGELTVLTRIVAEVSHVKFNYGDDGRLAVRFVNIVEKWRARSTRGAICTSFCHFGIKLFSQDKQNGGKDNCVCKASSIQRRLGHMANLD